jgi:hypothetical protein
MPPFRNRNTTINEPPAAAPQRRFDLRGLRPADLYDAWLFAAADATLALADWRSAARSDKRGAHAAYVAALDREAHAASLLEFRLNAT